MLTGKFHQTANGRKSYEIFHAKPDIVFPISEILVTEFGCTPPHIPTVGVDTIITKCCKNNKKLYLGWDNWSGFYLFSDTPAGDKLVDKIGSHLNELLESGFFSKFKNKA